MEVRELAPGLWRWTARHPAWTEADGGVEGWGPDVAATYCEAAGDLLLIDPIVPAGDAERERFWRALDRDVERVGAPHILLTCAWHARSSADVLARYPTARLWSHADDLAHLPAELVASDPFRPGEELPGGVSAIPGAVGGPVTDLLLWLPSHAALVSGDTLLGGGPARMRLCPGSWLGDLEAADVRADLRERLAHLPVERVLPAHGAPVLADGQSVLTAALR